MIEIDSGNGDSVGVVVAEAEAAAAVKEVVLVDAYMHIFALQFIQFLQNKHACLTFLSLLPSFRSSLSEWVQAFICHSSMN